MHTLDGLCDKLERHTLHDLACLTNMLTEKSRVEPAFSISVMGKRVLFIYNFGLSSHDTKPDVQL